MNLLLLSLILSVPPLNLNWDTEHKSRPTIEGYRHYTGQISTEMIIYVGTEKILNLETEIQLFFNNSRKITKAILILGPQGLNQENCIKKYNDYIAFMKEKYAKPSLQIKHTSLLVDEVLSSSKCHLIQTGMEKRTIVWDIKDYKIKAVLLGDQDGIYIETTYLNKKTPAIKNMYKKISKEIKK